MGLPEGWQAALDDHGRQYFYHHPSKTSQWEPPARGPAPPQQQQHQAFMNPQGGGGGLPGGFPYSHDGGQTQPDGGACAEEGVE